MNSFHSKKSKKDKPPTLKQQLMIQQQEFLQQQKTVLKDVKSSIESLVSRLQLHPRSYSMPEIERCNCRSANGSYSPQGIKQLSIELHMLQERISMQEQRINQTMQSQLETDQMVQRLCQSVESLINRTPDYDVFYKEDSEEEQSDEYLIQDYPHKIVVSENTKILVNNLYPKEILGSLVSRHALTHKEEDSVKACATPARQTRKLINILQRRPSEIFRKFLECLDECKAYEDIANKMRQDYHKAKQENRYSSCIFCFIVNNVDIRVIADEMQNSGALSIGDYQDLTNNLTSSSDRWHTMMMITPKDSSGRKKFLEALQKEYSHIKNEIREGFSLYKGSLKCSCSRYFNKPTSKSRRKPKTMRRSTGVKYKAEFERYFGGDHPDVQSDKTESTKTKFFREEELVEQSASLTTLTSEELTGLPTQVTTSRRRRLYKVLQE